MFTSLQMTLKAQKRVLRKATTATLEQLSVSAIDEQSRAISERVQSLPAFGRCSTISCYLSMPAGEVSTSSLALAVLRQPGKRLFVPKILEKNDGIMDFFEILDEGDLASLPSGTWGIKEPDLCYQGKLRENALKTESIALDMILLPAVAFDRSLARLGHGKGYYDRFISSYTAQGMQRPLLVGLALREQVLSDGQVPVGQHDWRMDVIVTPDEVLSI